MAKKKKSLPVQSVCSPAIDRAEQRRYEIEDGLRTMQRAGEIASDKALMKEIKALAQKTVTNVNKISK